MRKLQAWCSPTRRVRNTGLTKVARRILEFPLLTIQTHIRAFKLYKSTNVSCLSPLVPPHIAFRSVHELLRMYVSTIQSPSHMDFQFLSIWWISKVSPVDARAVLRLVYVLFPTICRMCVNCNLGFFVLCFVDTLNSFSHTNAYFAPLQVLHLVHAQHGESPSSGGVGGDDAAEAAEMAAAQ